MTCYPDNWKSIAEAVKVKAGRKCERCSHPDHLPSGHVLTVHHLDGDKSNCEGWNLAALCQRCHLHIQAKVKLDQMFFAFYEISDWFKPHLDGYLKYIRGNDGKTELERDGQRDRLQSGAAGRD